MDFTRLRQLNYLQNNRIKGPSVWLLICLLFVATTNVAHAATPVVDTNISLSKTGSEPFDSLSWTGDGPGGFVGGDNAGSDASEDDNIVRLQDSITYRVEVSVNDSETEDIVSTVTLNEKQKWITIPTGCKTDAADVGTQPVSSISADETTLTCNLGPGIEGTTKVFFPAARAVGVDPVTGDVTRNDDVVTAGVSSQAFSVENGPSVAATDGPTEVVVTGFFRVDLQKELKSTATDPDTGASLYAAPIKTGEAPDNRAGSIIEYTIKAVYVNGSLVANGNLDTTSGGSPGVASYRIIDVLTDDNTNNDTATLSTGAKLYTWDASTPACELLGDHGALAAVTCMEIVAAIDDIGPGGAAPDGLDDLAIQIDLTDIDVADPDNDTNLFEIRLNIWFDKINDIDSHPICVGGGECINTTTNRVGFWDTTSTTLDSFDETNDNSPVGASEGIVSTEDTSGNNVDNYNDGEEPFPNEVSYPLTTSLPGSYVVHKSFTSLFPFATAKFGDQTMAAGETRPYIMNVFDYRKIDQAESIMCDKIDTQVFEYAGVAPPNQIGSPNLYAWNQNRDWNPVVSTFGGANGTTLADGSSLIEFFFSNHPYTADPLADQAGYIAEMRTATCDDDLNGDGAVVIQQADGTLVDENGDAATGTAVDWWVEADDVPPTAGGAGAAANVTRVRQDTIYDAAFANAQDPTHTRFAIATNHLITAKIIAVDDLPYGDNARLPNFASWNRQEADGSYIGWNHVSATREDPLADATFAIQSGTVDRMTMIDSSHSIDKYTDPRGIKVVRGGDAVDFIIEGQVFGLWDDTVSNTATIGDNLPNGTDYVANSEMFSSDGGVTWYTRAEWDARFLAGDESVELTSSPHAGGADPLSWAFGSLNSSDAGSDTLPLIKYTVDVDPARVSGTFTNTASIDTGDIGGDPKQAAYQLTILPEFGLDVLKSVDQPIYQVNSPFSFDLVYKNLGGEDYIGGEFIDILPYNGDAAVTTGGVSSARDPESGFNGIYDITSVTRSNGEIFFATIVNPATIEEDPCHASNLAVGFDPLTPGNLCELYFEREGALPGGGTMGTNSTGWVQCSGLSPLVCGALDSSDITAIKFSAPSLSAEDGGQIVTIELEPTGNIGGTPDIDSDGNATELSTGDIYTNTFGGRIAEISLNVISNDVSVTVVSGSIGDAVWFDEDGDGEGPDGVGGALDPSEPPIIGASVALLDENGDPVYVSPDGGIVPSDFPGATPYVTTTDSNGMYLFENLPPATYSVQVTPPAGTVQSYDADGVGSPNISTHELMPVTDSAGQLIGVEDNEEQDFGYRPPLQIGSTVWLDTDNDGMQDALADEPGIEGVVVQLFPVGADPLTDTPVDMVITDTNGDYLLSTAIAGDYFVYIPEPPAVASLSSTPPNTEVNADGDVDGDDNGIQFAGGDPVQSAPVTLNFGGEPDDAEETAPGTGGELDNALDRNGNMTVDFGFYPTGSIGDTIWYDLDGDGNGPVAAGDGSDTNESGIAGVTVTLSYTDLDGTPQVLITTTDINGSYLFDDLPLNLPGDYTVTVDTDTLPLDLDVDLFLTSDPDGGDENTSIVSLTTANPDVLDQDFGYQPRGAVGDTIWYDTNNDGVIDADEIGIEGVRVTLTPPLGADLGAGIDVPITTMTDENGNYLFPGLPAGQYDVTVDTSTLPSSSYIPTYDFDDDTTSPNSTSTTVLSLNDSGPIPFVSADLDQDFGYVESVAVGGYIWSDQNSDGIQDADELPIEGSTVTLLNADGTDVLLDLNGMPVLPVIVGADGQYLFDNLLEGDYKIQVTKPDNFVPTTVQNDSGLDDNVENDSNIVSEPETGVYESGVFTLVGGTELVESGDHVGDDQDDTETDARDSSGNMTIDFGFIESASIGDTVWIDLNNDGIKDDEEDGIAGVTVNLYEDTDGDGVLSEDELASPVATVETDDNGEYEFPDLTPGVVYQIGVDVTTVPDGLIQTFDENDGLGATDGLSGPITLEPGEFHDTADFGYIPVGSIGDIIMIDIDGDGILDPDDGDIGLEGVTVTLTYIDLDGVTEVVLETQTDENGLYLFEDLPGGLTYDIEVDTSTLPGTLGDDLVQTFDADGGLDNISQTTLEIVDNLVVDDLDQDFGYAPLGAIGDKIWYDTNNDGFEDPGELGIPGVTVQLTPAADVDLGAGLGEPITLVTDDEGNYLFENLPVGDYSVEVIDGLPDAYIQTADPDATLDGASNVTLSLNEDDSTQVIDDLDQDFGYVEPVAVGGFIWDDMNGDGLQDSNEAPIPGSIITLLTADGSDVFDLNGDLVTSVVVGQDGQYIFDNLLEGDYKIQVTQPAGYFPSPVQNDTGDDDDIENDSNIVSEPMAQVYESGVFSLVGNGELTESGSYVGDDQDDIDILATDAGGNMTIDFAFVQPASIGDTVWLDENNDGVQDPNEARLAGVTVNLYEDTDGDGEISGAEATTPVATVVTSPDGEYLFPGLEPSVVYQTGVDVTTVPDGLLQTYDEGDGIGAADSLSDPIVLDPGEFHDTADFGYGPSGGAIGDTIWIDTDGDGEQGPGELGLGGVVVNLTYIDDDGTEIVLTTVTASDGTYLFTDLPLDKIYEVEVNTDTLPEGYAPSELGDPDVRDGNSTDADNKTYITLTADTPVNLEADFGYLPPEDQNNTIGDTIYLDEDGSGDQEAGVEPGIEGVTVALLDEDGAVIAVTTTDENGNYSFTGVPDGGYEVVVTDATGVLSGLTQTGDPDEVFDNTSTVILDLDNELDGLSDLDQDFGYQPSEPLNNGVIGDTIFLDADSDGLPGEGEGLAGVTVELYDGEGNLVGSTVTDENGNYLFDDLEISEEGVAYEVRVDITTLPEGLSNSVDPDSLAGVGDNTSQVILTNDDPENLDQDFGYISEDMNTLSGTIWLDTDGDGVLTESGTLAGVTVELLDEDGNLFQMAVTDVDGNYTFTNLPDGTYTVVVTDEDQVLSNYELTKPSGTGEFDDGTSKNPNGYTVDLGLDLDTPATDPTADFGYMPIVTNPISLGSFNAATITGGVQIDWATQTEVSNLGFNVYAQIDGQWSALNDSLIVSQGDSISVQTYSLTVAIEANAFALGDIDVEGVETIHGPFMLDQSYGEIGERQTIDWSVEKTEREAKEADRESQRQQQQRERNQQLRQLLQGQQTSYLNQLDSSEGYDMQANKRSGWVQKTAALVLAAVIPSAYAQEPLEMDLINFETTRSGMYQVSYEDLLNQAAPLDLSGVPIEQLALVNQGKAVQIQVIGSSADVSVFGSDGAIRFIAEQVDTLYSDTNVYTLRLVEAGNEIAQRISVNETPIPNGASATAYLAKARFAPQANYSFASPEKGDPWYATRIQASGEEASDSVQLNLDNVAPGGNSGSTKAKLKVNVWGASSLPGVEDDHSVKLKFNNNEVISDSFDGLVKREINVTLDQIKAGKNKVEVVLPMDTSHAYDAVNVDEIEVSYPRQFVAINNQLDFVSTFRKFNVSGLNDTDVVIMREDTNGVSLETNLKTNCRGSCSVLFAGTGQLASYYVSNVDSIPSPLLAELPVEQDITSDNAQYLIISHPDFIEAQSLQAFELALGAEFDSVKIVDVEAIYAQFGHHVFDPAAIQTYIQDSVKNRGTEYVLLIGGDVYDYRNFENEDATSFIPSIYASTGDQINFAPVDAKYVDLDDDNVPDLPIGRLPVRTVSQLDSLLSKRTDYVARSYNGKILLVADEYDDGQQYDFADDADEIYTQFFSDFNTSKVYVDDYLENGQSVTQARRNIVSAINEGQSMTAFFGHSSTNQWAFNGLFTGNDAAGLANFGKPTIVTQWGCWNAYYVSPSEDSMGHRFMMEGEQGAVAVMGATTLTNANSERKLARLVLERIANGDRLGDAITSAKQAYAVDNPGDLDVLLGWTLLGLPDLLVN